jgi:hypothetical protein
MINWKPLQSKAKRKERNKEAQVEVVRNPKDS